MRFADDPLFELADESSILTTFHHAANVSSATFHLQSGSLANSSLKFEVRYKGQDEFIDLFDQQASEDTLLNIPFPQSEECLKNIRINVTGPQMVPVYSQLTYTGCFIGETDFWGGYVQ